MGGLSSSCKRATKTPPGVASHLHPPRPNRLHTPWLGARHHQRRSPPPNGLPSYREDQPMLNAASPVFTRGYQRTSLITREHKAPATNPKSQQKPNLTVRAQQCPNNATRRCSCGCSNNPDTPTVSNTVLVNVSKTRLRSFTSESGRCSFLHRCRSSSKARPRARPASVRAPDLRRCAAVADRALKQPENVVRRT